MLIIVFILLLLLVLAMASVYVLLDTLKAREDEIEEMSQSLESDK